MNIMELLTITKAHYAGDYRIETTFSNGIKKMLDFSPVIKNGKGIVKKLADLNYFKAFKLDPFTIDWNNEIGFDPQDLYNHGVTIGYDRSAMTNENAFVAEPLRTDGA